MLAKIQLCVGKTNAPKKRTLLASKTKCFLGMCFFTKANLVFRLLYAK